MPDDDLLAFYYVIGRSPEEARESEFFANKEDARQAAYFHTAYQESIRNPLAKKGYVYNTYAVPVTVHWGQLYDELDD